MGEMNNAYKILVRKVEENRPVRRPRHKWADIGIDLKEIE
jgi:hypothetical protein